MSGYSIFYVEWLPVTPEGDIYWNQEKWEQDPEAFYDEMPNGTKDQPFEIPDGEEIEEFVERHNNRLIPMAVEAIA